MRLQSRYELLLDDTEATISRDDSVCWMVELVPSPLQVVQILDYEVMPLLLEYEVLLQEGLQSTYAPPYLTYAPPYLDLQLVSIDEQFPCPSPYLVPPGQIFLHPFQTKFQCT